jgi:hypothetical protein
MLSVIIICVIMLSAFVMKVFMHILLSVVASLTVCGVKLSTEGMPHKSYLFDGLGEAVGQVPVKHQVDALLLKTQGPFEAVPADGDQHGGRDFALGRVASPCQVVP